MCADECMQARSRDWKHSESVGMDMMGSGRLGLAVSSRLTGRIEAVGQ